MRLSLDQFDTLKNVIGNTDLSDAADVEFEIDGDLDGNLILSKRRPLQLNLHVATITLGGQLVGGDAA